MPTKYLRYASLLPFLQVDDPAGGGGNQDDDATPDLKPDDKPLGEKGEKALEAERDARKEADKRAKAAQKELDELKAARAKDDEDKAKEQGQWKELAEKRDAELAEANQKLAEREFNDRRATAAKKAGLPDDLVSRLTGETDEELEADAKALAKLLARTEDVDTDSGKRDAAAKGSTKKESLLTTYKFGQRR